MGEVQNKYMYLYQISLYYFETILPLNLKNVPAPLLKS